MGRHVSGDLPAADRLVEDSIREIGAEIDALHLPALKGVVLGGGFARGEGGVFVGPDGSFRLSNDLDFYVVVEDDASPRDLAALTQALEGISKKWTRRLSVDVDFCAPKTPWRIRHDQERLMIQELLHGYFDVAGERGESLFAGVARFPPDALPWMEAARLLVNRGAGLLLAAESNDPVFIARNLNKCILGAGDARLIASHRYAWRAEDRAAALGDELYSRAVAWKFRPTDGPVCDAASARAAWFAAEEAIRTDDAARRSLYHAARWLVRRRSIGDVATFGMDPIVRILRAMRRVLLAGAPFPPELKKDWQVFN